VNPLRGTTVSRNTGKHCSKIVFLIEQKLSLTEPSGDTRNECKHKRSDKKKDVIMGKTCWFFKHEYVVVFTSIMPLTRRYKTRLQPYKLKTYHRLEATQALRFLALYTETWTRKMYRLSEHISWVQHSKLFQKKNRFLLTWQPICCLCLTLCCAMAILIQAYWICWNIINILTNLCT
jgi:hypothetical protein